MITLGFNYSQMHDSSACIVRDGELLYAVAEERISRIKHDAGFPHRAIRACLDFAKVRADQLDAVCQGWPAPRRLYARDLKCFATGQYPLNYLNVLNSARYFASMAHQHGGFSRFTHHFGPTRRRCVLWTIIWPTPSAPMPIRDFDEAAVVVMDGRGAWEASSIWRGHNGRLEHVLTIPWPNSLGLFYAQFTQYLGFVPNSDEWKVMGLAPYGKPGVDLSNFILDQDESYRVNAPLSVRAAYGTRRSPKRLGPRASRKAKSKTATKMLPSPCRTPANKP